MKQEFSYLVIIFFIVSSCKIIKIEDKKSYKKINKNSLSISKFPCSNDIYKQTNKKLNGKYRIKGKHITKYGNFKNGLINGFYIKVDDANNNLHYIKSHFIKGNKNGIEEEFFNNKLFRKCNYINNIKQGKEYFFDKKNGDTLDVVTHYYNPNYSKPNFYKLKFLNDINEQKNKKIELNYNHSTFIGKLKLKGDKYYMYYVPLFAFNDFFYLSNNCKKTTCIIEINNVYFLGIADFNDYLLLYELENNP